MDHLDGCLMTDECFEEIVLGTEEKQFSLTNAFLENRMRRRKFFGGSSH